mmetsp:Transcript_8784/g.25295  ORF Transcript_8784/g.25295 Transcript_8784/m.25295 type:complete len:201 (-) Transcript_8784:926-1528(-)
MNSRSLAVLVLVAPLYHCGWCAACTQQCLAAVCVGQMTRMELAVTHELPGLARQQGAASACEARCGCLREHDVAVRVVDAPQLAVVAEQHLEHCLVGIQWVGLLNHQVVDVHLWPRFLRPKPLHGNANRPVSLKGADKNRAVLEDKDTIAVLLAVKPLALIAGACGVVEGPLPLAAPLDKLTLVPVVQKELGVVGLEWHQ